MIQKDPAANRTKEFEKLFKEADKTRKHNLTSEQIEVMDSDLYG